MLGNKCRNFDSSMGGTSPFFRAKDGSSREATALRICGSLRLLRGPVFYLGTVPGVDQRSNVANFQSPSLLALIGPKPLRALFG